MNFNTPPAPKGYLSIILGFTVLFTVYHFHEFFQSFTLTAVTVLSFVLVSHLVARAQKLNGIQSWGLAPHRKWWLNLVLGLALGSLFVGLSTAISIYFGYENATASPGISVFFKEIGWIMVMTFWPSLAEDILTRGYLFKHLGQRMPASAWVLLSATVYVLNHIWRLTDHPSVLTYLFILGLVLATAMVLTKSLWLTLGIHWAANIVYYITVQIFALESATDGYQSTWVLAFVYLLLFILLLAMAGIQQKYKRLPENSIPDFA